MIKISEIVEINNPIFVCVSCGGTKVDQRIDNIYNLEFIIEAQKQLTKNQQQNCTSLILCDMCMWELSRTLYYDYFDPGNDD